MDEIAFLEFKLENGKRIMVRAEQIRGMLGDDTATELYITAGEIKRAYSLALPYDAIRERLRKAGMSILSE